MNRFLTKLVVVLLALAVPSSWAGGKHSVCVSCRERDESKGLNFKDGVHLNDRKQKKNEHLKEKLIYELSVLNRQTVTLEGESKKFKIEESTLEEAQRGCVDTIAKFWDLSLNYESKIDQNEKTIQQLEGKISREASKSFFARGSSRGWSKKISKLNEINKNLGELIHQNTININLLTIKKNNYFLELTDKQAQEKKLELLLQDITGRRSSVIKVIREFEPTFEELPEYSALKPLVTSKADEIVLLKRKIVRAKTLIIELLKPLHSVQVEFERMKGKKAKEDLETIQIVKDVAEAALVVMQEEDKFGRFRTLSISDERDGPYVSFIKRLFGDLSKQQSYPINEDEGRVGMETLTKEQQDSLIAYLKLDGVPENDFESLRNLVSTKSWSPKYAGVRQLKGAFTYMGRLRIYFLRIESALDTLAAQEPFTELETTTELNEYLTQLTNLLDQGLLENLNNVLLKIKLIEKKIQYQN